MEHAAALDAAYEGFSDSGALVESLIARLEALHVQSAPRPPTSNTALVTPPQANRTYQRVYVITGEWASTSEPQEQASGFRSTFIST